MYVFVYGSLKKEFENSIVMKEANGKFISKGITSDADFDLMGIGDFYPTVIKGDKKICGEIYEVDNNGIQILDMLEGYPNFYDKKEFSFDTEKGKINALMYIMTNESLKNFNNKYIKDSKRISRDNNVSEWLKR